VGIVVFNKNLNELQKTVDLAISLGVSDVRIISAAQWNKPINLTELQEWQYPILAYRVNNMKIGRNVRGIKENDNHKCPLVLDDMAVENGLHYPCIIYLRENGKPIGKVNGDTRKDREEWYLNHDCYTDDICRNNCLDVCVDYNNRVREMQNVGKDTSE